jgi:hypothetical protein
MPTVLRADGFDFVIHFNDYGPANVHVSNADGECRIVLEPTVMLDRSWRMKEIDARRAVRLAIEHSDLLRTEWRRIHGTSE